MFRWSIDKLVFNSGDTVTLTRKGPVLIVGPNSSGKSLTLRGIAARIQGSHLAVNVIDSITPAVEGSTPAETEQWLRDRYPLRTFGGQQSFVTRNGQLALNNSMALVNNPGQAWPFLVSTLDTETRLSVSSQAGHIDPFEQPPQAFAHVLLADDVARKEVSDEVMRAFDKQLIIDVTGSHIYFRVGKEPATDQEHDRLSTRYLEDLKKLPRLQEEGDGIRSFVGAVLAARCGRQPVLLIDEPEAFLHPPQARRLGQVLCRTAMAEDRQVIAATHSADVIQGALDVGGADVMVIRITRDGNVNRSSVLAVDELKALWSKPLLRSSAAIDGLFHRGAVVVESDGDSRIYEAELISLQNRRRILEPPDVYFANGAGKGELAALSKAYRSLGVAVAIIGDLDLLKNEGEIRNVLTANKADLDQYRGRYRSIVGALAGLPPTLSADEFADGAEAIAGRVRHNKELSTADRADLERLVRDAASWSDAKRYGISKLRGGQLTDAKSLLNDWHAYGVFLVPVGELEGWWPAGPQDKGEWVVRALEHLSAGEVWPALDDFLVEVLRCLGVEVN